MKTMTITTSKGREDFTINIINSEWKEEVEQFIVNSKELEEEKRKAIENGYKIEYVTIKTLKEITENIDMILFNKSVDFGLYIESWEEYQKYSDIYTLEQFEEMKKTDEIDDDIKFNDIDNENYKEIYQYFAINKTDWEYLAEKCGFPLYYSDELDIYILWIDFLDNWENISYKL